LFTTLAHKNATLASIATFLHVETTMSTVLFFKMHFPMTVYAQWDAFHNLFEYSVFIIALHYRLADSEIFFFPVFVVKLNACGMTLPACHARKPFFNAIIP
jgi:hypothetical protein